MTYSDIPAELNSLSQLTPEMFIETVVRSLWLITNGDAKVRFEYDGWLRIYANITSI